MIYLLKQYQEWTEHLNTTIQVYLEKWKAEAMRDALNEEYYVEDEHYYTVEPIEPII